MTDTTPPQTPPDSASSLGEETPPELDAVRAAVSDALNVNHAGLVDHIAAGVLHVLGRIELPPVDGAPGPVTTERHADLRAVRAQLASDQKRAEGAARLADADECVTAHSGRAAGLQDAIRRIDQHIAHAGGPDDTDLTEAAIARVRNAAALHRKGLVTTAELYAVIETDPEPATYHGPTAAEAAADDRNWWGGEKTGE